MYTIQDVFWRAYSLLMFYATSIDQIVCQYEVMDFCHFEAPWCDFLKSDPGPSENWNWNWLKIFVIVDMKWKKSQWTVFKHSLIFLDDFLSKYWKNRHWSRSFLVSTTFCFNKKLCFNNSRNFHVIYFPKKTKLCKYQNDLYHEYIT